MTYVFYTEDAAGQLRSSACGSVFLFPVQRTSSTGLGRYRTSCWKFSSSRELCSLALHAAFLYQRQFEAQWTGRVREDTCASGILAPARQQSGIFQARVHPALVDRYVPALQTRCCEGCGGWAEQTQLVAVQVYLPFMHCSCIQKISGPRSHPESRWGYLAEFRGWKSGWSKACQVIMGLSGFCAVRLMPGRSMSETFHWRTVSVGRKTKCATIGN